LLHYENRREVRKMSRLAAVVGSKAGWLVLRETPLPGPWSWFVAPTFEEAMQRLDNYEVVAVDAPLGLAELPEESGDAGDAGIRDRYRRPAAKVREVHAYLHANPGARHFLYEVHPHLSFLELRGGLREQARSDGKPRFRDQLSFLCDVYPSDALYQALTAFRHAEASRHDILDAFAMLWSAKRIATSRAERLPSMPVYDARGFDMAIWY
jgi:predicted RNase H-like nuclease